MFDYTEASQSNHRDAGRNPMSSMEVVAFETINSETYITHYDVKATVAYGSNKESYEIHNPKVINPSTLVEKLNLKQSGLIDPRVLVDSGNTLIWQYTPSPDQCLYYKYRNKTFAKPIKWCNFIFKLQGNGLSVFAVQHKSRPTEKTRLYFAPLPNVYSSGIICLGSCSLPRNKDIDVISECYFDSVKTHLNNRKLLRDHKEVSDTQFLNWIKTKTTSPIRVSELKPFGTLKDIL
ncbi:hypothetical protein [Photobacterium lutimaris]|uniref:PRTRC system protein B n=1 Tax=Photobacterium lutimaris TaxID=388278 RepID=A0A2T3ITJ2_9GAMM|nr:hypothetical protein [Photobacterium lutimaris]PSU31663.1 hypothetical protein C9I99_20975 [Photobacterium lutimaris]TDR72703.1 PRTRC genetic system protein B [Photobacterium lutimaris]